MAITAIMNLKGGTAKTVTTVNMAAILDSGYSRRVCVVDADSQANTTEFLSGSPFETEGGLADLLRGRGGIIRRTKLSGVDLIPADDSLMELDLSRISLMKADPDALRDFCGKPNFRSAYQDVIIDCPPAFTASSVAALIAADRVIIPMKLDAFGIRGMSNLMRQIQTMKDVNPKLTLAGILPTMYYRSPQMAEAEKMLQASGLPIFTPIRRSPKVDDMTFAQTPLIWSSPKSAACRDYRTFVGELLKGGK